MKEKRIETFLLAAENGVGHKQRRIFKRKRAGVELTREQVKAIKMGRKLLKVELKAKGLKEKSDLNLMASTMGLYFDQSRWLLWWRWLLHGKGLWVLGATAATLLLATLAISLLSQLRGHFTINMTNEMFREGFVLSDSAEFIRGSTRLLCTPAEEVPCISVQSIPENIDQIDGQHNDCYFAYTFYIRNDGDSTVDYEWHMALNSESRNLSSALWVMIFEDGEMLLFAQPGDDGGIEALPAIGDDSRGYLDPELMQFAKDPSQFQLIKEFKGYSYYRLLPIPFETDTVIGRGMQQDVAPGDVHKYTVVIWLEGDDPDCTDALIGGHAGMDFNFRLIPKEEQDS